MSPGDPKAAWLAQAQGAAIPLASSCVLGRAPASHVVLADGRVSRRHAVVHDQGDGEFWLVDLGSSNGTYVNDRRIAQPTRLYDRDRIQLGPFTLTFRQPGASATPTPEPSTVNQTLADVRSAACWLMVADIQAWSRLAQQLPDNELPKVSGRWFRTCRQLVERHSGSIKKYVGDGWLAAWPATDHALTPLVAALAELRTLQADAEPPFRVVLHRGRICIAGGSTPGEENLLGSDLNFVFRMEKLASQLSEPRLLSEAAHAALEQRVAVRPLGKHTLPGFDEPRIFYAF
jgi:adenylate cyclase